MQWFVISAQCPFSPSTPSIQEIKCAWWSIWISTPKKYHIGHYLISLLWHFLYKILPLSIVTKMALLSFVHIKIKYSFLFFRSTRKERQEILHSSLWNYYFLPSIIVEKHYTWKSHHHNHQTRPKLVQAVWKFCKLHVFVERGGKWNRRQLPNKFRQKEKSPIVNATSNIITQFYLLDRNM